jgi:cytidylate kinase
MFVFLTAPYEVLVERVRARDVTKGKELNLQRFDEVYKIVMHKDFSQYLVLDTSMLSVTQIAQKIMM